MKSVIYKYPLTDPCTVLELPAEAQVRYVGSQDGNFPTLWIELPAEPQVHYLKTFEVRGTGYPFDGGSYIGTAICGPFVWHVFEVKP